jgi:hypothetical protein
MLCRMRELGGHNSTILAIGHVNSASGHGYRVG